MGTVVHVPFPLSKKKPPPSPQKRLNRPWRVGDLRGERPKGHPNVAYGKRGKVLLATKQVWVAHHNQELVVVVRLMLARKGSYPNDVVFDPYRGNKLHRQMLSEAGFRSQHEIWNEFMVTQPELMAQLDKVTGNRALWGFDENGYRTD